jgi:hypothetical protein
MLATGRLGAGHSLMAMSSSGTAAEQRQGGTGGSSGRPALATAVAGETTGRGRVAGHDKGMEVWLLMRMQRSRNKQCRSSASASMANAAASNGSSSASEGSGEGRGRGSGERLRPSSGAPHHERRGKGTH